MSSAGVYFFQILKQASFLNKDFARVHEEPFRQYPAISQVMTVKEMSRSIIDQDIVTKTNIHTESPLLRRRYGKTLAKVTN